MTAKTATEVVQDALFSAIIDAVMAVKNDAKGMPNTVLREVNAMHANSTFADLPEHVQKSIRESTKSTLNRLRKEGFSVTPTSMQFQPKKTVKRHA